MPPPSTAPAAPSSSFTTDYWRRQEQHLAHSLSRLHQAPVLSSREQQATIDRETRHLQDAKASYDRMLADLTPVDRARIERLMTSEMTMLMLAVTNAAGDLALASLRPTAGVNGPVPRTLTRVR